MAAADPAKRDTRRRFEQWAHNPTCEANTISAVHGISMTDVAKAEGLEPSMGQSPFAIARGQSFERGLFWDKAKTLRDSLETAGVLAAESDGYLDFRLRQFGGKTADLDKARDSTSQALVDIAHGRLLPRPTIIASPTLLIPSGVMLPEALLVIDVVAIKYQKKHATIIVGEIKTYPDRGGYTDPGELALARAQAGVYVHALRMVIATLGLSDNISVSDRGFLVLSRPGYNKPSVRANEDLRFQAERARRGFEMLEAAATRLPSISRSDEGPRVLAVQEADTHYNERCVSFCDRVERCRQKALACGDPSILGDDVVRFLGAVTLTRLDELEGGSDPRTIEEQSILARLKSGN